MNKNAFDIGPIVIIPLVHPKWRLGYFEESYVELEFAMGIIQGAKMSRTLTVFLGGLIDALSIMVVKI